MKIDICGHPFDPYLQFYKCINVVIDIETLGTDTDKGFPVTQIGAAWINIDDELSTFSINVDSEECQQLGLMPDGSTVEWVMTQPDDVINSWFSDPRDIKTALTGLNAFISEAAGYASEMGLGINVWGNSPVFDLLGLSRLYDRVGITCPWKYQIERCYRTLMSTYPAGPQVYSLLLEETSKLCPYGRHNATFDAVFELLNISVVANKIEETNHDD